MHSLFSCPLCHKALLQETQGLRCTTGHRFDRSAAGYVHLLPANRKHSKSPGDDKQMVQARSAFLKRGYYAPLREALCQLSKDILAPSSSPTLLDCGCGEGYYTAGLHQALINAGHSPQVAGVDLSKFAVRRAAKRLPQGEFAVASVYHLPLADGCVDLLLNVFSPLAVEEFARVLRPGGALIYVVPSARHLWQLKQVLYEIPYENPIKQEAYPGFTWLGAHQVRFSMVLEGHEDMMALFGMTPYAWKTPKQGVERLARLDVLTCEAGFDLHLYQKQ